jgi:hypothetical protein
MRKPLRIMIAMAEYRNKTQKNIERNEERREFKL